MWSTAALSHCKCRSGGSCYDQKEKASILYLINSKLGKEREPDSDERSKDLRRRTPLWSAEENMQVGMGKRHVEL